MDRSILQPERISVMLGAIRNYLAEADKIVNRWDGAGTHGDERQLVAYYVENAFVEALVLLESLGLSQTLRLVEALSAEARTDYASVYAYEGDLYLVWPEKLRHFLNALQHAFGRKDSKAVTKDVSEILRACEYIIGDRRIFPAAPKEESDIHDRIEGILRAVFPDLRRKPNIDKPIKNFQPDTGLPSLKTLIEYKYVKDEHDVKRVSDELLADSRGYVSPEWNHLICVIYERGRFQPERKWEQHLRDCGLTESVSIILLRGEVSSEI